MRNKNELSKEAIEARRQYMREWRRKNPDKVRIAAERFWLKKAAEYKEEDHNA